MTIIDEIVARSAWHGESPIGKTIEIEGDPRVVVGVVEHVKNHSLTEDVRGVIYFPVDQSPRSPLTFVLRAGVEPLSLVPAVRAKLHEHNPNLALGKIRPMTGYVERAKAPAGFTAVLAAIFGVLALRARGHRNLRRAQLPGVAPPAGDGNPRGRGRERAATCSGWSCAKGSSWPLPVSHSAWWARWLPGAGWARCCMAYRRATR